MSAMAAFQVPAFPRIGFTEISLSECSAYLENWGHRMGPLCRPCSSDVAYALYDAKPVAVLTQSSLIRERVAGAHWLCRENTIEVSRICADRPTLCRVVLRLWREFVFPVLNEGAAISYQDAQLHTGNLYRFDGWRRLPQLSRSGTDQRSGRKGRNKWIWCWPPSAASSPGALPESATRG